MSAGKFKSNTNSTRDDIAIRADLRQLKFFIVKVTFGYVKCEPSLGK